MSRALNHRLITEVPPGRPTGIALYLSRKSVGNCGARHQGRLRLSDGISGHAGAGFGLILEPQSGGRIEPGAVSAPGLGHQRMVVSPSGANEGRISSLGSSRKDLT